MAEVLLGLIDSDRRLSACLGKPRAVLTRSVLRTCARSAGGQEAEQCPVCHEPLGPELVILPCGHQLCCKCSMSLVDRQSHVPQASSLITGTGAGSDRRVVAASPS